MTLQQWYCWKVFTSTRARTTTTNLPAQHSYSRTHIEMQCHWMRVGIWRFWVSWEIWQWNRIILQWCTWIFKCVGERSESLTLILKFSRSNLNTGTVVSWKHERMSTTRIDFLSRNIVRVEVWRMVLRREASSYERTWDVAQPLRHGWKDWDGHWI